MIFAPDQIEDVDSGPALTALFTEAIVRILLGRLLVRPPIFNHLADLLHPQLQIVHAGSVAKPHEVDALALYDVASFSGVDIEEHTRNDDHLDETSSKRQLAHGSEHASLNEGGGEECTLCFTHSSRKTRQSSECRR